MSRLFPVLLILLAVGLFLGYVNPTYTGSITTLSREIHDYDRALASAKQFKEKEVQLTAERNAISPEALSRLQAYLPDSVDNVQLILDLNSLAARSGVSLSNFEIEDSRPVSADASGGAIAESGALPLEQLGPTDSLRLSVTARGTYDSFRTFLGAIEGSLRPLDVVDLEVKDSTTGVYSYSVTFRLYWLR